MKITNRFTKICVLLVTFHKEPINDDYYIIIRYLVNERQPKLEELSMLTSFLWVSPFKEPQSLYPFFQMLYTDHETAIPDWAIEYVGCLYCFI